MGSFPSKIPISLGILYGKSMGSLLTMRGLPPENPTALNLYHYIHWKVEDMMRLNTPTNERFRYYTWCLYDMPMIQSEILGIFLKHINCSRISTSYISWSSNCSGALAVSFRDHISPPARLSRWFSKLPQVGYGFVPCRVPFLPYSWKWKIYLPPILVYFHLGWFSSQPWFWEKGKYPPENRPLKKNRFLLETTILGANC